MTSEPPEAPKPPPDPVPTQVTVPVSTAVFGRWRWAWWLLAYASLGLGIVGIVVPGLPTVPFVLLSAFAAARGSERLHAWLLAHRRFGPMIYDWQTQGAVSRRSKRLATIMMVFCAVIMFLTAPKWWMAATGSAIMVTVSVWLWRRPEPRRD
jgi:uncharacterized protein